MTFSQEDGRKQVNARLSDHLWDLLDEEADNKTEYVAESLRRRFRRSGKLSDYENPNAPGLIPPDNSTLATAYKALLEVTESGGNVFREEADPHVAQETGIKKDALRHTIYQPLQKRGYIGVQATIENVVIKVRA